MFPTSLVQSPTVQKRVSYSVKKDSLYRMAFMMYFLILFFIFFNVAYLLVSPSKDFCRLSYAFIVVRMLGQPEE